MAHRYMSWHGYLSVGFEDPGFLNYGPSSLFYQEARFTLSSKFLELQTHFEGLSFLDN